MTTSNPTRCAHRPRPAGWSLILLAALLSAVGAHRTAAQPAGDLCAVARRTVAQMQPRRVTYGFYTDFNPLSYAATQDQSDPAFNRPLGYEPSLVAAVETFAGGRLSVSPVGIGNPFAGIWLKAADTGYDLVGGGVAPLDRRTRDGAGRQVIRFGVGHLEFRQSLLVRTGSAIERHGDLTAGHTVGVLRGTTGESRLLALTGITDAQGVIGAGARIELADGAEVTIGATGGGRAFRIAGAGQPDAIAGRVRLRPAGGDRPEVIYFNSEAEQVEAVLAGVVDAIARGEVGNLMAARERSGLRVTAFDDTGREPVAFSYPATPDGDALRGAVDGVIRCLTDDGAGSFAEWLASDGTLFAQRAAARR